MHVVLADPPAFTPPYDHELATSLARAGARVELVTAPFRFGARPVPEGYELVESCYRRSSGIRSDRLRRVAKVLEHPFATRRLVTRRADVLHLQWLAAPELDVVLLRTQTPLVFTAHDLIPRRTAHRAGLWRRLFARFDRIVVHSERGRAALVGAGVDPLRLRVIPHPVFRSETPRADDGRTVLAVGVIRPYKGLPDAVAATLAVDGARLLVAGDPRLPLDDLRARAGSRAEWRLGYLGPAELERALSEATVAVFPYREELDQSGALLQALGAGVPAVVYDVGGLGEVVARFAAGRVVPPGDLDGLQKALREMLDDPDALAEARAGAASARDELTWEASAAAHLAVYEEIAWRLRRRDPLAELVERQLALFAEDERDLLAEAGEAEAAWNEAGRDTAEEAYGDYQLVVDAIADRLLDLRETYAATLEAETADTYRHAFAAGAARRFRRYASLVADLEP